MKLRLGQPVDGADGPYGELADVVIDPDTATVTHLVIEPHHEHDEALLLPTWLTSSADGRIEVGLDRAHIRRLPRVAFSNYTQASDRVSLDDEWDFGVRTVRPLSTVDWSGVPLAIDVVRVDYDRIPAGECEIRRRSTVETSDGRAVGHVAGLITEDEHTVAGDIVDGDSVGEHIVDGDSVGEHIVDGDSVGEHIVGEHIVGVAVRCGFPGLRRRVVVPLSSVATVATDRIRLSIDRDAFRRLPATRSRSGGQKS